MAQQDRRDNRTGKPGSSRLMIITGVMLVVIAIGLMLWVQADRRSRAAERIEVTETLRQTIPENPDQSKPADDSLSVLGVGKHSCVGLIEIPAGSDPVAVEDSEGDGRALPRMTVRQPKSQGSPQLTVTGTRQMFGALTSLRAGDTIRFTDVYGVRTEYRVTGVSEIDEDQVTPQELAIVAPAGLGRVTVVSCESR